MTAVGVIDPATPHCRGVRSSSLERRYGVAGQRMCCRGATVFSTRVVQVVVGGLGSGESSLRRGPLWV